MQLPCKARSDRELQGGNLIHLHNYLCMTAHTRLISKVFNRVWDIHACRRFGGGMCGKELCSICRLDCEETTYGWGKDIHWFR